MAKTPEDFNEEQVKSGKLTKQGLTALVKNWQGSHSLQADGFCGPKTLESINKTLAPPVVVAPPKTFSDYLVEELIICLGQGESGANNSGSFIKLITQGLDPANWCAALISHCAEQVALKHKMPIPWGVLTGYNRLRAKVVIDAAAKVGKVLTLQDKLPAGTLVCINRGLPTSSTKHIFTVEKQDEKILNKLYCIEGNSGAFPTVTKRTKRVLSPADVYKIVYVG